MECDYVSTMARASNVNFNSRTHVECDRLSDGANVALYDFNSRTHVECDPMYPVSGAASPISTHTLTWSATCAI